MRKLDIHRQRIILWIYQQITRHDSLCVTYNRKSCFFLNGVAEQLWNFPINDLIARHFSFNAHLFQTLHMFINSVIVFLV